MANELTSQAEKFDFAWNSFDNMISKNYLDVLGEAKIVRDERSIDDALKSVQVDKITKIVYDKDEDNLAKLNSVFSAVYASGSAVFILLCNTGGMTNIYIGVNAASPAEVHDSMEVLEHALKGNFPGFTYKQRNANVVMNVLSKRIHDVEKNPCIAALTGVPSLKNEDHEKFTQGLEKLIEAMGKENYTALLLAEPISKECLTKIEEAYQNLYSELSLLNVSQLALSEQESVALGKSLAKGFSDAITESIAQTHTTTHTSTIGHSSTVSHTNSTTVSKTVGKTVGSAITGGMSLFYGPIGAFLSRTVTQSLSTSLGVSVGRSTSKSESESQSESNGTSDGTTTTTGNTHTTTTTTSESQTDTTTTGKTYQYEVKNKRIVESLNLLDEQLKRIRVAKNYGAWNWGAYIVAPDSRAAKIGADIFAGILQGEQSGIERSAITFWDNTHSQFKNLADAIAKFRHPLFALDNRLSVMPTAMLSTPELTVGMSLPQKSLPGLPVFAATEFGRSVSTFDGTNHGEAAMEIGEVSHLGTRDPDNKVRLNLQSLASHTFVTGSTGSGKSNAIYMMLDWLHSKRAGIPFLVIEPAKGEYKDVFGGLGEDEDQDRSVNVYGTNPYRMPLLQINPFAFPNEIHVMEHIDRLIEILNAVWPMYAAMPAILKEAVEKSYQQCGWDLLTSKNRYDPAVFPDFHDLLQALPEVINSSQYADEVKSNYSGALLTRVRSLTNGYYRTIFQKDEIPPQKLFDKSCIIDLSRIGSTETKSLLMGVIFLKLQEYRMATATGTNAELRHITVIEEAHNLLRRTSAEQGMETANLQGKSVEMIANAIAEMRTYGEGFIIADQAPGLLDPAVIRNTNTKIVLRLPDYDDRQLVGKAQNLKDGQIEELARLATGCASVYQNDWQEAVLCQFHKFDKKDARPFTFSPEANLQDDSRTLANKKFVRLLLRGLTGANDLQCLFKSLPEEDRRLFQMYFPEYENALFADKVQENDMLCYLDDLLIKAAFEATNSTIQISDVWEMNLMRRVFADDLARDLDDWLKDVLWSAVCKVLANKDKYPQQKAFWEKEQTNVKHWRVL